MEENKTTYQCPFCGQMVIISVGAEDPREEAIAACTCFGAQRYIRIRRQKEQTRENLEVLIGEKSEDEMFADVVMLAQYAGDLVCEEEMDKATLQIEKETVTISRNQKGIVKVSRTSKRQQSPDG